MRYHLFKASRTYQGSPYQGPSNNSRRAEAETLEEAIAMYEELSAMNNVGWAIFDSVTRNQVYGVQYL